ncbi:MAG: MopE-related protein, partial [Flavobacteriales bacterium]
FGAQTVTIQNGGTFRINNGGFVNTNAPFYGAGSTLQYWINGTYGRSLEWSASSGRGYPHHVQISNNTIVDPANTGAAQANTPLRTAGNLTIDANSAMYMDFGGNNMTEDLVVAGAMVLSGALSGSQASGSDIFVGGNWQNDGTSANFFPNNRAVFLNGTGTQTISGTNVSFPAFPYLFINNTAGSVSLSRDVQVTELLNFSAANVANVSTGANTLFVSKNTTTAIERFGSGHVIGNLRRAVTTGSNTYNYPIGDATAYAPVSLALNNVTVAGSLTCSTTTGDHPQVASSGVDAAKSVNRYYSMTNTGVTLTDYNPTFNFVAGDLDAGVNTSNLLVARYNSGWTYPTIGTRTSTSTAANSISSYGDFAIAECKSPTAFNVTGGGAYCQGGSGVAVGIDGSEAWVNYQLKRDGANVGSLVPGTGSAISFGSQTAGGVYTVEAYNASSVSCSTPQTGSATISVNPTVTPVVSIAANTGNTICTGSSVTFTATPQFGGVSPVYQWKLNGVNVGSNAATYNNSALVNGDVVTCAMTSSEACPTSASVNSNAITMSVLAFETPTISVSSATGTATCSGVEVTFTTTTAFAGLTPSYQWKINGSNVGSNANTYSSATLANGDQVSCVLTSNYQCLNTATATSNSVTMTVTPAPQVDAGVTQSSCGTAPITVSGATVTNAASYSWSENGIGSITSGASSLTPTYAPATGDIGTTVTLTLTAVGNGTCANVSDVVSLSVTPLILFYVDGDGDGFGNPLLAPVAACTAPVGRVANNTDCCDSNPNVNPATEWWVDADGDGFGSFIGNGGCISGCSGEAQNIPYYPAVNGGIPYTADCNDGNTTIYPGANELCQNSVDEDCDALIDEGCSGIANDTYANATLANTTNPNAIFPNCLVYNGTTLNADISPQANTANVAVGGGRDVWYRFVAPSSAVRIRVVPVGFDAVIELRTAMPSNTQVDVENANATTGGLEILNKGGLTPGQTYYVAVRNYNATAGGSFSICISPLMPSGCAYVVPVGGFSLCSSFKAVYRGATSYTFNFTGTGGNAAFPYATTSASSTGLIALNTPSLDLRNSGVYSCRVDANYILQDGTGATEPVITVLGSTASSNCTGISISAQSQMVVRSNQVCPAVLNRSTFLVAIATDGSSQACGAVSYTYRFTQVTDCSGSTTSSLPFTVNTTGSTPYLSLGAAFPSSSGFPLANIGYWKVEVRPNFSYGFGTFGPSRVISVNNTSSTMGMLDPGFEPSERETSLVNASGEWSTYPNPGHGDHLSLLAPATGLMRIRIYDMVGSIMWDGQAQCWAGAATEIRLEDKLSAGVYLIEIHDGHQAST